MQTKQKTFFKKMLALLLSLLVTVPVAAGDFNSQRTDFRDESIYFVITTRFYDGDPANNVLCWDNKACQVETGDPCWRGDFQGLIDKLDYIKALGFTAIWITPVVQNASGYDYHGYHAMDFTRVDCRYQSGDGKKSGDVMFKELVEKAHAKGLKIVLDIVLNHTGNFGEQTLCPEFTRNTSLRNQADITACMLPDAAKLGSDYNSLPGAKQHSRRLALMKNTDGQNHDTHNYWHHVANAWNWDYPSRWWGQIAGDCVDLNTENDAVAEYLVKCYGEFIKMGVDGFRIDTSGHISRLTFNKVFIPQFAALGEQYKGKRLNQAPFFMYGEVCARYSEVQYRGQDCLSPYFYTWRSPQSLLDSWNGDAAWWDTQVVPEGAEPLGNMLLCLKDVADSPTSDNTFMLAGAWHEPDHSQGSGFNVIDFPLHYNFSSAKSAFALAKGGDSRYNDATYNVVYVDSHDYGPQPDDKVRFNGSDGQWAENLSLMFTFRGIPCLYYGSEVGFRRGATIDNGPNGPLSDTGRAYFGGYITGDVKASDFGTFEATGNAAASLNHDLAQHLIRLNKIRQAVPALRKGQWTDEGCTAQKDGIAFKRAYKDSYALVALNGGATFTGCPSGTFTDVVTGKQYSGSTITVEAPQTKGQVRVLVKDWTGGAIGADGPFIYTSSPSHKDGQEYDGREEAGTTSYFTEADAVKAAKVTLSPEGGSFRTPSLSVTATLDATAQSGWYQVEGHGRVALTPGKAATFSIGGDMGFGDNVTVAWGAVNGDGTESNGSATYRKVDPDASITVYVKADKAPYLYAWTTVDGKTTRLNGEWPGTQLSQQTTVDGVDYWTFTADGVESLNIIFNNGSGAQTADIKNITATSFFAYDGGSGYERVTPGETPDPDPVPGGSFCAFFAAPSGWTTVRAWVWNADNGNYNYTGGAWPGELCVKTADTYKGMAVWKWEYKGSKTAAPTHIIFNNGSGEQTANLAFVNGKCYDRNGLNPDIVVTAIGAVAANRGAQAMTKVYSLSGECVAVMPDIRAAAYVLRPGVYVAGGRKFVVR